MYTRNRHVCHMNAIPMTPKTQENICNLKHLERQSSFIMGNSESSSLKRASSGGAGQTAVKESEMETLRQRAHTLHISVWGPYRHPVQNAFLKRFISPRSDPAGGL